MTTLTTSSRRWGKTLHSRARELGEVHGITGYGEPIMSIDVTIADIEHTVHELAHGLLLKLTLDDTRHLSAAIANMLHDLGAEVAVTHERRSWSVEWNVIRRLGLPTTWDDVLCAGEIQGITETEDKELMFQEVDAPWAREHAETILSMLQVAA